MTLGEKISALRNQLGMSQGDLAEKINVSRQSVSKWETNTSVPELDKLIQLSELFQITLDELVKGDIMEKADSAKEPASETMEHPPQVIVRKTVDTRKIIGTILLCFGALIWLLFTFLGSFLEGILFGSPFLLCGIICLSCQKNAGLWCAWAVFLMVNLYLRYATGITWHLVLFTLNYEPSMNYARLAFAWLEVLCTAVLVLVTVLRFQKKQLALTKRGRILYIAGWIALALLFIPIPLNPQSILSNLVFLLWDWLRLGLVTVLTATTFRLIRTRKARTQN